MQALINLRSLPTLFKRELMLAVGDKTSFAVVERWLTKLNFPYRLVGGWMENTGMIYIDQGPRIDILGGEVVGVYHQMGDNFTPSTSIKLMG